MTNVKKYREMLSLSQEELSARTGVACSVIEKLESNRPVNCKLGELLALAKTLGHSFSEVFPT